MKKLFLIFLFLLFTVNGWCATYYVATDGSGDYTTIAQVNAATLVSGDFVYFNKGDTWAENLYCKSNVTYNSYGSGVNPILNSINCNGVLTGVRVYNLTAQVTGRAAAYINGGSDIIFDSCIIDGNNDGSDHSMFIRGSASNGWINNVIIRNTEFKNTAGTKCGLSIENYVKDTLIENCTFHDNTDNNLVIYNNDVGRSVAVAPYNITLKGNICYNATNHGIEVGWDANLCKIEENYLYDNGNTGLMFAQSFNNTAQNNLIINNRNQIIVTQAGSKNNKIYHNTLIAGINTVKGLWFRIDAEEGNIYKNNLIYGLLDHFPDLLIETTETVEGDYNLIYNVEQLNFLYEVTTYTTFTDWQSATSQDLHSIALDPLLTDTYKLKKGSPCIDSGIWVGVSEDYWGHTRPSGAGYDIGAYEYGNHISNAVIRSATIQ